MRTLTNMPTDWSMLFVSVVSIALTVAHAVSRNTDGTFRFPLWPAVLLNGMVLAVARLLGAV
jgi:hypothetical protein